MSEELVLIARVRKVYGLKGEVEIEPFTWNEKRFKKLTHVFLKDQKGTVRDAEIESVHYVHKGIRLKFKGCDDRTAAEHLRGVEILIPEQDRAKLPKGRAYYDEIIGLAVVDDETSERLGTITNVLDMPASDIFVLDLGGREHLLTNSGEEIRSLDLKKRELRVKLLEPYSSQ